jgi:hypothetical protein
LKGEIYSPHTGMVLAGRTSEAFQAKIVHALGEHPEKKSLYLSES